MADMKEEMKKEESLGEESRGRMMAMIMVMKVPVFFLSSQIMRKLMYGLRFWQQST